MRIGRQTRSENLVFSLEKVNPSSSSSSSEGPPNSSSSSAPPPSSSSSAPPPSSSSSAPPPSSSSSAACGPFDASITTQFETPNYYYGESIGISLVSVTQAITLNYTNLDVAGPAFIMDIQIGAEVVASATVAFGIGSQLYLGKPFSIVYEGVTYCGVFTNGTVVF